MSYLRNIFTDVFFSMAPGNMKSDFIGLQRSKLNGKSYSSRKSDVKNSDISVDESVSIADENMDHQRAREGVTITNNAAEADPSATLNATAMVCDSNATTTENAKELLLAGLDLGDGGCIVPENIGSREKLSSEISHLKVLSMLHLDVIEQQQRQIQLFEREAQRLKAENETLKCRLERMNRRTHLAEKTDAGSRTRKLDSPAAKRKYCKSETDTPVSSPNKLIRGAGQAKEGRNSDNLTSSADLRRRQQRRAEKLAKKEEKEKKGTPYRQDSRESSSREAREEEKYQRTDVMYPCLCDLRVTEPDMDFLEDESIVTVPSWRIINIPPGCSSDNTEDCDEATFEQRHSKLEQDERKRKRWDIQRIRELREHERLVNKQKQRESAQWGHILTTFYPEDNDAEDIEVSDTIPLISFGVQVPAIKPSEFELPWFDAKERERDEQRRKTRSRTSRR